MLEDNRVGCLFNDFQDRLDTKIEILLQGSGEVLDLFWDFLDLVRSSLPRRKTRQPNWTESFLLRTCPRMGTTFLSGLQLLTDIVPTSKLDSHLQTVKSTM
ncbi:hypothetical protein ANCCAN_29837 [Ancylostoma caninum]|uniref:Uncharacterized protein n=1 Tax=Ancylostoma caninum TaxID=29170 RepID=A0A368EXK2_ANCCA|nr:hypothetical protein ANCCAN_29837 [Ancylostoma caninum]